MRRSNPRDPSWEALYQVAAAQEGMFTTAQAAEAGYSSQLLAHHLRAGRISRVRRGVYRLVHFPAGEHEDLVTVWLWSGRQGVFSHQTALSLYGLSDVLPARVHLTVPSTWRRRRLRAPAGVVLHHADVSSAERAWVGSVPSTSPVRTLADCAAADLAFDLLRQAVDQAVARGLVSRPEIVDVERLLGRGGAA